jgi:hypothetical protein
VVVGGFGAGEEPLHESVFVGFGGFDRTDGFALTEEEIDGEFVEVGECAVESIALLWAFGFGEDAIASGVSGGDRGLAESKTAVQQFKIRDNFTWFPR